MGLIPPYSSYSITNHSGQLFKEKPTKKWNFGLHLQSSSAHNIAFLRNWVKYIVGFYQGEFFGLSDVNFFATLRADFEYYFQCLSWFYWLSWFVMSVWPREIKILNQKHSNKKSEKYPRFTGIFQVPTWADGSKTCRRHDQPGEPIKSTHTLEMVLQISPQSWKNDIVKAKISTLIKSHYIQEQFSILWLFLL